MARKGKYPVVGRAPTDPPPQCLWCDKPLRPSFRFVQKVVEAVVLSEIGPPSGHYDPRRPETCDRFRDKPAEIDPETGQFVYRDRHTDIVGLEWDGTWGYDHRSLFCTLRCGYEYGCRAARQRGLTRQGEQA